MRGGTVKVFIVLLLAAGFVAYLVMGNVGFKNPFREKTVEGFADTGVGVTYEAHSRPSFYAREKSKGFFCATKDVVKFVDETGYDKMSLPYPSAVTSPVIKGAGDFAAVGERGGTFLYVVESVGLLYQVSLKNPLMSFSVNARGESCAITQKEDAYVVSVYSQTGSLIHEVNHGARNVFPVSAALSADGRLLAVVFHDITGVSVSSRVTFYMLNKSEAVSLNLRDAVIGEIADFKDETAFAAAFVDGNRLVILSDKSASCIETSPKLQKSWRLDLKNRLGGAYIGRDSLTLLFGKPNVNADAEEEGAIKIFSVADMEMRAYIAPRSVQSGSSALLGGGDGAVVVSSGGDISAVSLSDGSELWSFTPQVKVSEAMFVDKTSKLLVVCETNAVIMGE